MEALGGLNGRSTGMPSWGPYGDLQVCHGGSGGLGAHEDLRVWIGLRSGRIWGLQEALVICKKLCLWDKQI